MQASRSVDADSAGAHAATRRDFFSFRRTRRPALPFRHRALHPATRMAEVTIARRAMACEFSITFPGRVRRAVDAGCAALDEIGRLERKLSIFLDDSDLAEVNRRAAAAPVEVDAEVFEFLNVAQRLWRGTAGAFDPAAGTLVRAWGFTQGRPRLPEPEEIAAALEASGMRHVALDPSARSVSFLRDGLEINPGSLGKGFALDRALAAIRRLAGDIPVLLEGGQSSILAFGPPPGESRGWKIAIGDPHRPGQTLATLLLRHRALATSGAVHQFFEHQGRRFGHIIDPRTGWPPEHLVSATVLAPSAAEADALSTAFFVLGIEGARAHCREHPEIGAILVTHPAGRRNVPIDARVVVIGNAALEEPDGGAEQVREGTERRCPLRCASGRCAQSPSRGRADETGGWQ